LQRAVARFLDMALPDGAVWSAIGHGGGGKVRGAILKAMGLKAGIPDVLIIHRGRPIFIELKAQNGRLSLAQQAMHNKLTIAGALVAVCRSVDEVQQILECVGIDLRAKVAA